MNDSRLPKVVQDCHQCLLWMIPKLDNFPRNRRFTLGEKIEQRLLDLLELLTRATYQRKNQSLLVEANSSLAVLRHLWRLCFELRLVSIKAYQFGANMLVEIGRQVGGWHKANL